MYSTVRIQGLCCFILPTPIESVFSYTHQGRSILDVHPCTRKGDIINNSERGGEAGQIDSYSPYIKDLNLSTPSPYSASWCVNLHHLTHMIGCLTESPRPLNAKVIAGCNIATLANLAAAISWSRMESAEVAIQIASSKDAALVGQQRRLEQQQAMGGRRPGGDDDSSLEPNISLQEFTPAGVVEWLSLSGCRPTKVKLWAAKRMEPIVDIRVGSVGEHLKNYTAAWSS